MAWSGLIREVGEQGRSEERSNAAALSTMRMCETVRMGGMVGADQMGMRQSTTLRKPADLRHGPTWLTRQHEALAQVKGIIALVTGLNCHRHVSKDALTRMVIRQ
jgi:hypothetical protein